MYLLRWDFAAKLSRTFWADKVLLSRLENILHFIPCHRMEERCPQIDGHVIPLCSRCIGCIVGFAFSFLFIENIGTLSFPICLSLVGVMLMDWSVQQYLGIPSTHSRRMITGTLAGIGLGSFFWDGVIVSFRILAATIHS